MHISIEKISDIVQFIYTHRSRVTLRDVMHEFSNEHGNKEVDEILKYLINEQMIRIDGDKIIHWLYVPEIEGLNNNGTEI